jgi:hypothetical protein
MKLGEINMTLISQTKLTDLSQGKNLAISSTSI